MARRIRKKDTEDVSYKKENPSKENSTSEKEITVEKATDKAEPEKEAEPFLPVNVRPIGSCLEDKKEIYILQKVYKEIHSFTKDKTKNESGGVLLGRTSYEFKKPSIKIEAFVEARYTEATPSTLTFTHETWEDIHKKIDKKYSDLKIVGWIHTHPGFGIFLSEYDTFIQENFFNEPEQVAYVVDPIQDLEGFFVWNDKAVERSNGFYVYDKVGSKISVEAEKEEEIEEPVETEFKTPKWMVGTIIALILIIITMSGFMINMNNRINKLENFNARLSQIFVAPTTDTTTNTTNSENSEQ